MKFKFEKFSSYLKTLFTNYFMKGNNDYIAVFYNKKTN